MWLCVCLCVYAFCYVFFIRIFFCVGRALWWRLTDHTHWYNTLWSVSGYESYVGSVCCVVLLLLFQVYHCYLLFFSMFNTYTITWAAIYRLWCWSWKRHTNTHSRQQWQYSTAKNQAVGKIAVKCCKVTTVYIRSWIAEESTRIFIFDLLLNGFYKNPKE